jgi:hypothetical protein
MKENALCAKKEDTMYHKLEGPIRAQSKLR